MKYRVVGLTFVAYAFMHALRTGYSFSKTYFKEEYQFSSIFLAVLDSTIFLSLGLGFLFRYCFLSRHNMVRSYFIAAMVFSISFILFPTFSILNLFTAANAEVLSVMLMFLFGFFQMHQWPISLILVNDYCTNEEDGVLIALWSSHGTVGNIIGFFFSSLLIINAHLSWQIPQIIMGFTLILFVGLVYLFVERKNHTKTAQYLELQNNQSEEISCSDLLHGLKQFVVSLDNALLLITACAYKAIIYTFLLWLPIYVTSKGQGSQSALVSIIFNVSNVIGSAIVGKFYESDKDKKNNYYIYLQYLWPIMAFLTIVGLVMLIMIKTYSPLVFTLVIFMEGFVTGSIFNVIVSNQMIKIAEDNEKTLDINSTIIFAIPTLTIGIAQLLIGLYMALEPNKADQYQSVFIVMLGLAFIGFVALALRSYKISQRINNSQP